MGALRLAPLGGRSAPSVSPFGHPYRHATIISNTGHNLSVSTGQQTATHVCVCVYACVALFCARVCMVQKLKCGQVCASGSILSTIRYGTVFKVVDGLFL